MELLLDRPFKVYGLKLTKSESITNAKGAAVWDGTNNTILLGQFNDITVALHFAENVKNNSPKKSWKIEVRNLETESIQEIGYTDRENYNYRKPAHVFDKNE